MRMTSIAARTLRTLAGAASSILVSPAGARARGYARWVGFVGFRFGIAGACVMTLGMPSAEAGESVRFDGFRAGLGGALVVSTWRVDQSDPVDANAFASIELGGAVGWFGFWYGATLVFPGWTNICTAPAEPFGCSSSKVALLTGVDWLGAGMRIGPWIGVADTFMPSVGVRVEWLPLDVGRVGAMGFSLRASALAFPPFTATVPAVGANVALRFDLFADRR